jgi:hypothetical protein
MAKANLPTGHGRIVRDDAGNVLRIELPDDELESESPAVDSDVNMEQMEPQLDGNVRETWVSDLGGLKTRLLTSRDTDVVKGELNSIHFYLVFFFSFCCLGSFAKVATNLMALILIPRVIQRE